MARLLRRRRRQVPKTQVLSVPGFPRGLNTLVNPNRIRNDELAEAINVAYTQYGVLKKRSGTSLIVTLPASPQGFGVYNKRNEDGTVTKYFCAVAGGIFYTIDPIGKTSTEKTGFTFHTTNRVKMVQGLNTLYIFDGSSHLVKWDGTAFTQNTEINSPTSPGVVKGGSGTGSTTHTYIVTASNGVGETLGTTEVHLDTMPEKLNSSTYATFSWTGSAGATLYNIYKSITGAHNATYLTSTSSVSFIDQGQADSSQSVTILVPEENTTGGPILSTGTVYHDSLVGVDAKDKSMLWYSGGGEKIESFSPGDGGSWYRYHAEEGEDINGVEVFAGLGTDYLYIFKDHKIGQGSFNTSGGLSVKDVNLSVGGSSDAGIIPFEQDMAFWSPYGGYTLRMEPNFVNILRIAELTIRVHPTYVSSVTQSALPGICGVYDKTNHVLLWSIPQGGSENTTTLAYDPVYLSFSEYRGIKAKCFTRFVDDNKNEFTYGGDADGRVFRLFEGNDDMGTPITFRVATKCFDMDSPWAYKFVERAYFIFGNINATNLTVNLLQDGVSVLKEFSIASGSGNTGWEVDLWDSILWDTSSGTPVSINNRIVPRHTEIRRDLFSIQAVFEDTSATSNFEILGMYVTYRPSSKPPPSSQRV